MTESIETGQRQTVPPCVPVVVEECGVELVRRAQRRRRLSRHVAPRVLPMIGMEEKLLKIERDAVDLRAAEVGLRHLRLVAKSEPSI